MHKLTPEQTQHKEVIIALAIESFRDNPLILNDYVTGEDWRLVKIEGDIRNHQKAFSFKRGDITVARKDENPGASMPAISAFSWRTKRQLHLHTTDPVQFLED